jgi:hypothetical protein
MSDILNALLVILLLALPGIAGNAIYTKVTGTTWREEPWRIVLRVFSISIGGLLLYAIVGSLVNTPLPSYLSLETLDTFALKRTASLRMSLACLGHFMAAMIVGFVAGKASQWLDNRTGRTRFVDSWHEFVSVRANGHWVVVGINSGATYAGYVQMADPKKKADERDIILAEPAVYRPDQEKYFSLPYNFLYLPGKIVDSVAIANSEPADRLTSIDQPQLVFSEQGEVNSPE